MILQDDSDSVARWT